MLNEEILKKFKKEIHDFVDNTEIEPSTLSSAYYDDNPYGVESHLLGGSGCWMYDEDEMWDKKKELCLEILEDETFVDYISTEVYNMLDLPEDGKEYEEAIEKWNNIAIEYVNNL